MSPRASPRLRSALFANAYLLLILTALFWAGNAIAGKLAAGVVTPVGLTFWRWLLACVLIGAVAFRHLPRDIATIRRYWLRLFLLGALGFSAFNFALYAALNYTGAINVTIEQSCMPAVIMLIGYVAFRQPISVLQGLGVAVTIAGVVVTASRGAPLDLLDGALNRGDALMVLAVLLYAGYTVALRWRPAMHWLSLLFSMSLGALLFSAPFYAFEVVQRGPALPSATGWAIVVYTAVFPSLLSQLFFLRGVELLGPNRAGVFINLVPVFGALLAVLVLGESFEAYHLAGLVMVLGGIALAERFAR